MAPEKCVICASADLPEAGKGVRFRVQRGGREAEAFAIRFHGRAYAYLNECGHVPAQLDWLPGAFFDDSKLYLICSVHGALYAPETGLCLGGRCQGCDFVESCGGCRARSYGTVGDLFGEEPAKP